MCVSHADPIKAAVAHALGTHLDLFQRIVISTCAISVDRLARRRPDRAGRQLDRRLAARSCGRRERAFFEFDEVDTFTAAAIGEPGLARVLPPRPRRRRSGSRVKCEKQQVTAIAQYLRRVLSDLPPPEDRPMPGAVDAARPGEQSFVLGPIGLGYDRGNDRAARPARGARRRPTTTRTTRTTMPTTPPTAATSACT